MARYNRDEAREWARENLAGAVNCTIPSFTSDLKSINERAIRHDTRRAIEHGFTGALAVAEVAITLPEYVDFQGVVKDQPTQRIHDHRLTVLRKGLADAGLKPSMDPFREFFIGCNPA